MISRKFLIITIIFFLLVIGSAFLNERKDTVMSAFLWNEKKEVSQVCFESGPCVKVEIAETPEEKAKGLMYRENLKETEGMLFPYLQEGHYPFWMKNMNFPLDIIWINKEKRIVYIHENVPPCQADPCHLYSSQGKKAQYVLEVRVGFSKEQQLQIGQKVLM